jgi:uncharacterized membrane protein
MEEIISSKRKFWAGLSYFGIFVLLPLTKKHGDDFIIYHAKQGVVLIFFFVATEILIRIAIETKVWLLGSFIYGVGLLYIIIGVVNCVRAKKSPLPFIGKIAEKITV